MSMSIYAMHNNVYRHGKFECYSLKYCPRYYYSSTSKNCVVKFETLFYHDSTSSDWEKNIQTIYIWTIFTAFLMGISWTVSKIIEHLLFSWLRSVWLWMKVKVNIINTGCIVTEAVTFVKFHRHRFTGFWAMAGDGQTNKQTHYCVYVNVLKVKNTFKTKRRCQKIESRDDC